MRNCAQWRGMSDEECYEVWNGGQGVLVVIDPWDVNVFVHEAIRHGIEAKVAGKITSEFSPRVLILSKFSGKPIQIKPSK